MVTFVSMFSDQGLITFRSDLKRFFVLFFKCIQTSWCCIYPLDNELAKPHSRVQKYFFPVLNVKKNRTLHKSLNTKFLFVPALVDEWIQPSFGAFKSTSSRVLTLRNVHFIVIHLILMWSVCFSGKCMGNGYLFFYVLFTSGIKCVRLLKKLVPLFTTRSNCVAVFLCWKCLY